MKRTENIRPSEKEFERLSQEKWNAVAKPLHSMGEFESIINKLSAVYETLEYDRLKKCVLCMCADNGVVCEGVSQTDSSVTALVAQTMADGTSNINILADSFGADVFVYDVGMCSDVDDDRITRCKTSYGTKNIAVGPAMTHSEAEKIIAVGIDAVKKCRDMGYNIIATGEMGIGNTTTSSAIASAILGLPAAKTTGRGAGLDNDGLERKINVIDRSIEINRPDSKDALDILAKLGGFDIAALMGVFLGGAIYHVPIVIDGFISLAAAALAKLYCPCVTDYMIASHMSMETASVMLMDHIGLKPVINAGMHLGEGTGAVMMFPLIDSCISLWNSVHTFGNMNMEQYTEKDGDI